MDFLLVDVREADEFSVEHIEGSVNLPLSTLTSHGFNYLKHIDKDVKLMCLSGKRAGMALDTIKKSNIESSKYSILPEKGIMGWKAAGKEVIALQSGPISIFRQVLIAAGFIILLASFLGTAVNYSIWYVATAVGAGLTFAGVSGICFMTSVLKHMPWNKPQEVHLSNNTNI